MKNNVEIPEGIQVTVEGSKISVTSGDKTLNRSFPLRIIKIEVKDNVVTVTSFSDTAKSHAMVGTFLAHLRNMIKGLQEPFTYKLKVCSSHFPMTVKQSGNVLQVQNFLGEKTVRKVKLLDNVTVKVEGQDITVSSTDIEAAGTTAARIELITRLRKKDRRVFQDGIFITEKAGKSI